MSPRKPTEYVATSISRSIIARLDRVHRLRGIRVYSGPPGIGKTTALRVFASQHPGQVAVVTVPPGPKGGVGVVMAGHLIIEAIWRALGREQTYPTFATNRIEQRSELFQTICTWADIPVQERRRGGSGFDCYPLTIIFDEAQNLSREAIEMLRYLNDGDTGYAPVTIGLAFLGNNEFSLAVNADGGCVLTDAVRDRAGPPELLSYDHVTDDDLSLFIDANCEIAADAMALVIRYFARRPDRSIRRVADVVAELVDEAGSETPITTAHVATVLGLA